ncbi:hypothetical protein [Streptomyces sp. CMB-StM0423]|uniref:hypothetical protein n=1 Tax=Streptomyces sp. CMB-StM0423 TaxID=2059884 RepID=UPI001F35DB79|nr:hypothetical protein [Streptomyces sp. CMB-StM0423]
MDPDDGVAGDGEDGAVPADFAAGGGGSAAGWGRFGRTEPPAGAGPASRTAVPEPPAGPAGRGGSASARGRTGRTGSALSPGFAAGGEAGDGGAAGVCSASVLNSPLTPLL